MGEQTPSFKTAFKKFYASNSNPDESDEKKTKLDEKAKENLEKLKLIEQKRVDFWECHKEGLRILYPNNQNMPSSSDQCSLERASNENQNQKETQVFCHGLYICFLNEKTSEQTIMSYFEKFGPVHECCIERNKRGKSKGYGYVIFGDIYSVGEALSSQIHIIDGGKIKCNPIRSSKKPYRGRRLFISIPCSLLESDVKAYLERFARRKVDVFIKGDNARNSTKYGSATFKDSSLVHRFLNAAPHYIKGERLHADFYQEKSNETLVSRKLILLNLSPHTTDTSLKEYFGRYGELDSCVVTKWKNMLRSTFTGYLIFQWTAAVDAVLMQARHLVEGSPLTIIQPKEVRLELCFQLIDTKA